MNGDLAAAYLVPEVTHSGTESTAETERGEEKQRRKGQKKKQVLHRTSEKQNKKVVACQCQKPVSLLTLVITLLEVSEV